MEIRITNDDEKVAQPVLLFPGPAPRKSFLNAGVLNRSRQSRLEGAAFQLKAPTVWFFPGEEGLPPELPHGIGDKLLH
jgi:hypothetical protein